MTQRRQYISVADAAKRYSVSTRTIRRRIKSGQLKAIWFGPTLRVDVDELDAMAQPVSEDADESSDADASEAATEADEPPAVSPSMKGRAA